MQIKEEEFIPTQVRLKVQFAKKWPKYIKLKVKYFKSLAQANTYEYLYWTRFLLADSKFSSRRWHLTFKYFKLLLQNIAFGIIL